MKKLTPTWLGIFALAAALTASPAYAGPYTALYVFGDSLSDSGNDASITLGFVPSNSYYYQGRFSNGLNYADQLASLLGVPLTASLSGGTDYAYGGARANYVATGLPASAKSFNQQITAFASDHPVADPNALYTLWIGANDMSDVLAGTNPAANAGAAINVAVSSVAQAINSLYTAGAQNFLIPNLPDLGLIPEVLAFGPVISAQATALTSAYNAALASVLNSYNLNIFQFDTFALHQDMVGNPGNYGLSNVTDSCYSGGVDGLALPGGSTPTVCATPNSYFYWDFEHPTATVHQLFADQMYNLVPEPDTWLLLVLGFSVFGWQARRLKSA